MRLGFDLGFCFGEACGKRLPVKREGLDRIRLELRRNSATWLPALLLAGAVSCSAPKGRVEVPIALPEKFSQAGSALLPAKWWLSFNDATLNDLIEQALASNLSLQVVWDRLAQAEATAKRAGAPRWPELDVTAGASRTGQRQRVETAGGETRETSYRTSLSLGLVASYELDLWSRVRSTREAAALDVQATREQLQAAAITLSAQVAAVWYGLVEQRGQVDLLRRQLKINEDVLELVTLRFRRGQVGAADVLRQRQLVESVRGNISMAEAQATVLGHQLSVLLGRSPGTLPAAPQTELVSLPTLPTTGVPSDLVQNRPDIYAAYFNVAAADRRVAAAVADRFPRIGLSAQASTSGPEWRDLFNNWLATLAANIVAPVFDAGSRRAEVERTRAVASERLHAYGQAVIEALAEVEDALVLEQRQRDLIASLDRQLALSALTAERIRDNYTKGGVDYLRVLDALLTQQSLQRTQLQARRVLIEYRINLCRALAGGWELQRPELAEVKSTP